MFLLKGIKSNVGIKFDVRVFKLHDNKYFAKYSLLELLNCHECPQKYFYFKENIIIYSSHYMNDFSDLMYIKWHMHTA